MQQPEHEPPVQGEVGQSGEIYQSPEDIEHGEGMKSAPTSVQQGASNNVQNLTQQQAQQQTASDDPQEDLVEVVIPDQPNTYTNWKKKRPENSVTWLEAFWDRVVKKAQHFGWHVLVKQNR